MRSSFALMLLVCLVFSADLCAQSRTFVVVNKETDLGLTDTIFGSVYLNLNWTMVHVTTFKTKKEYKFGSKQVISILSQEGYFVPYNKHDGIFVKRVINGDVSLYEYAPDGGYIGPANEALIVGTVLVGLLMSAKHDYYINSSIYPELEDVCRGRNKISENMNKYFERNEQLHGEVKRGMYGHKNIPTIISTYNTYIDSNWNNTVHEGTFIESEIVVFRSIRKENPASIAFKFNENLISDFVPNSVQEFYIIDTSVPCEICFGADYTNCVAFDVSEDPSATIYIECQMPKSDSIPKFIEVWEDQGQIEVTKIRKRQNKMLKE